MPVLYGFVFARREIKCSLRTTDKVVALSLTIQLYSDIQILINRPDGYEDDATGISTSRNIGRSMDEIACMMQG